MLQQLWFLTSDTITRTLLSNVNCAKKPKIIPLQTRWQASQLQTLAKNKPNFKGYASAEFKKSINEVCKCVGRGQINEYMLQYNFTWPNTRTFLMLKCCLLLFFIYLPDHVFFLPCYIILQYLWLDCLSTSSRRLSSLFVSLEDSLSTFRGEIGLLKPTHTTNLSFIWYSTCIGESSALRTYVRNCDIGVNIWLMSDSYRADGLGETMTTYTELSDTHSTNWITTGFNHHMQKKKHHTLCCIYSSAFADRNNCNQNISPTKSG